MVPLFGEKNGSLFFFFFFFFFFCCGVFRGGPRVPWKKLICIKVCGFALLILSHFSKIWHENYFIFIGYLNTLGRGGGVHANPLSPLDPPLFFLSLTGMSGIKKNEIMQMTRVSYCDHLADQNRNLLWLRHILSIIILYKNCINASYHVNKHENVSFHSIWEWTHQIASQQYRRIDIT